MSDSYSEWQKDIRAYCELCKRYDETPEFVNGWADCYGQHAKILRSHDIEADEFEVKL